MRLGGLRFGQLLDCLGAVLAQLLKLLSRGCEGRQRGRFLRQGILILRGLPQCVLRGVQGGLGLLQAAAHRARNGFLELAFHVGREVPGGGTQVGLFVCEGLAAGLPIRDGLIRRPLLPSRLAYDLLLPLDHRRELLEHVIARRFRFTRQRLGFLLDREQLDEIEVRLVARAVCAGRLGIVTQHVRLARAEVLQIEFRIVQGETRFFRLLQGMAGLGTAAYRGDPLDLSDRAVGRRFDMERHHMGRRGAGGSCPAW